MQEQEQEMNLYDYLNIIIKRKRMILTIFFVIVITTTIAVSLVPKVYKAAALIIVLPLKTYTTLSPISLEEGEKASGDTSLAKTQIIPLFTHKELLKSDAVLERVSNKLKLSGKFEESFTSYGLPGKLKIEHITKTNLLQLEAKDKNPKIAKEIVDIWTQEYVQYSRELITKEVEGIGEFFTKQLNIAKQNLIQVESAQLRSDLKTKKDELKILQEEIKKHEKLIIASGIALKIPAQKKEKERSSSIFDLDGLDSVGENQLVNPIYLNLEYRIADTTIELNTLKLKAEHLKGTQKLSEKEFEELEKMQFSGKAGMQQIEHQVKVYKKIYNDLSSKIEEVRIAKAMQLGEVKIASAALEPKYPAGSNKKRSITLAAIVGLIFGVSLAIFMENYELNKAGSQKSAMGKDA